MTNCTSWEFIIFWKPRIFQNFWAMSFKNHWLTSYQDIYSNTSFPKAVNKTCPCSVTIFTSHHKAITSSRLLQDYYIKIYQDYYVTVTLTNHRPFQNRPTLDAKKCIFAHRRVVRVRYSESARWKLSFQKIKRNFFRPATGQLTSCTMEFIIFWEPIIFQNFWAISFKNHWLTLYQNTYSNISFPKAVNKTWPCGETIFTSHRNKDAGTGGGGRGGAAAHPT